MARTSSTTRTSRRDREDQNLSAVEEPGAPRVSSVAVFSCALAQRVFAHFSDADPVYRAPRASNQPATASLRLRPTLPSPVLLRWAGSPFRPRCLDGHEKPSNERKRWGDGSGGKPTCAGPSFRPSPLFALLFRFLVLPEEQEYGRE